MEAWLDTFSKLDEKLRGSGGTSALGLLVVSYKGQERCRLGGLAEAKVAKCSCYSVSRAMTTL